MPHPPSLRCLHQPGLLSLSSQDKVQRLPPHLGQQVHEGCSLHQAARASQGEGGASSSTAKGASYGWRAWRTTAEGDSSEWRAGGTRAHPGRALHPASHHPQLEGPATAHLHPQPCRLSFRRNVLHATARQEMLPGPCRRTCRLGAKLPPRCVLLTGGSPGRWGLRLPPSCAPCMHKRCRQQK
jgi:hypothetical protein